MISKKQIQEHLDGLPETATPEEIKNALLPLLAKEKEERKIWENKKGRWFFVVASVACVVSFLLLYLYRHDYEPGFIKLQDAIIYGLWLIVPPVWFLAEYIWIFPEKYKFDDDQLTDFKYVQSLASKFWAAVLILFGIILYYKYGGKFHS